MLDQGIEKSTEFIWQMHIRYEWSERSLLKSDKVRATEFKKQNKLPVRRGE